MCQNPILSFHIPHPTSPLLSKIIAPEDIDAALLRATKLCLDREMAVQSIFYRHLVPFLPGDSFFEVDVEVRGDVLTNRHNRRIRPVSRTRRYPRDAAAPSIFNGIRRKQSISKDPLEQG